MKFNEWYNSLPSNSMTEKEFISYTWKIAQQEAFLEAALRFEGVVPFNWVAADGYSNGLNIGAELRYMSYELKKEGKSE